MKLSIEAFTIIMATLEQALENADETDRNNIAEAIQEVEAIGTY